MELQHTHEHQKKGIGRVEIPFNKKAKNFYDLCPIELHGLVSREQFGHVIGNLNDMIDSHYPNDCDGCCCLLSCLFCLWPFVLCCIHAKKNNFQSKSYEYLVEENKKNPRLKWTVLFNKDKEIEGLEIVYYREGPVPEPGPGPIDLPPPEYPVTLFHHPVYGQHINEEEQQLYAPYHLNGDSMPLLPMQSVQGPMTQSAFVEISYPIQDKKI